MRRAATCPTNRGSLTPNPQRMKGTLTPTYRVRVPFMSSGMEEGFPSCSVWEAMRRPVAGYRIGPP